MALENAHKILDIHAYFKGAPARVLISNNVLAVGNRQRWRPVDLQDGTEEANRVGWIERAKRGWRLTQQGFDEVARHRREGMARDDDLSGEHFDGLVDGRARNQRNTVALYERLRSCLRPDPERFARLSNRP